MDEHELRHLIAQGLSLRAIAEELGTARWTVRREVLRLGLETRRMAAFRLNGEGRLSGAETVLRVCGEHGAVEHARTRRGGFTCPQCNARRVVERRRAVKATLIAEAGGRCVLCGYDRCVAAMQFHHLDPATKSFGLATGGWSHSLARARSEAAKCVLLCGNCHAEVEAGFASLPDDLALGCRLDRG